MRLAYADPPYLGNGLKLYGDAMYDDIEAHRSLLLRLHDQYDGWAYSLSSTTLKQILPLAPDGVRIAAWCKPFISFRVGVDPAYAWEPVLYWPSRKGRRKEIPTAFDWIATNRPYGRGLPEDPANERKPLRGAKPRDFCFWLFGLLRAEPDDSFDDLFPGSGIVGETWKEWRARERPTPGANGQLHLQMEHARRGRDRRSEQGSGVSSPRPAAQIEEEE